jgi:2'-5' RNA ligase
VATLRLFVAVAIEAALAEALGCVSAALRARVETQAPRARLTWVPPERLHFTLRFIGAVDEATATRMKAALLAPVAVAPFALTVGGLGTFPGRGAPRVVWAGVERGADGLAALAHHVGDRLHPFEVEAEAAYRPHLTLARVRDAAGLRSRDVLEPQPATPFGTMRVDAITLFESRLSPKGPQYIPLQSTPLS